MSRLPSAIFIVDIGHEHIALAEAKKLNIATFAMVDTNCDPNTVDYAIPANDDATKSITAITTYLMNCVLEGLEERKNEKVDESDEAAEEAAANLAAAEGNDDAEGADRRRRGGRGAAPGAGDKNMRKPAHKVGGDRKPR